MENEKIITTGELKPIMITSMNEYRSKNAQTKLVTLPSGAVFEIKKITTRDYIREGGLQLQTATEIVTDTEEKKKIIWNKLTEDQKKRQLEVTNKMIILAVTNPLISGQKEDGKLGIDDITDEDYYALLTEITIFSYGRQDLKPFRNESDAPDTGLARKEIRETSLGDNEKIN